MATKIEWATETWNPVIGCNKISAGCDNCYAEKMACRLTHISMVSDNPSLIDAYCDVTDYGKKWSGLTRFIEKRLPEPSRWKKPRTVFVCSMGDLFHKTVSFECIDAVFSAMADYNWHTYMILTKRPQRVLDFYKWKREKHYIRFQDKYNVWIGVTAENQQTADERIPLLLEIPAALRFVSCEPLLSHIEMPYIRQLDWIIAGGESGPGARPMHPDWVHSLKDQCQASGVPFFFKQWGGKKKTGRLLDGKEYNEKPII